MTDRPVVLDDDELARQALDAVPHDPFAPGLAPIERGPAGSSPLPDWYMLPAAARRTRGRAVVVGVVVASLTIGTAAGLCVTSGFPEIAW